MYSTPALSSRSRRHPHSVSHKQDSHPGLHLHLDYNPLPSSAHTLDPFANSSSPLDDKNNVDWLSLSTSSRLPPSPLDPSPADTQISSDGFSTLSASQWTQSTHHWNTANTENLPSYPNTSSHEDDFFDDQGPHGLLADEKVAIADDHELRMSKSPHRKDIEAKARAKMRNASQRLRLIISSHHLNGVAVRGTADVMDKASEILEMQQARIVELEHFISQFHPSIRQSSGLQY